MAGYASEFVIRVWDEKEERSLTMIRSSMKCYNSKSETHPRKCYGIFSIIIDL